MSRARHLSACWFMMPYFLPATGSGSDQKHAVCFGPRTRIPVYQCIPVISMPTITLRKPFFEFQRITLQTIQRNTRTIPLTTYYACSYYTVTAIHDLIMSTVGPDTRVPGYPGTRSTWVPGYPGTRYPFSSVSPWSACLTIPPDALFKNEANDPVQQAERSTLCLLYTSPSPRD